MNIVLATLSLLGLMTYATGRYFEKKARNRLPREKWEKRAKYCFFATSTIYLVIAIGAIAWL